ETEPAKRDTVQEQRNAIQLARKDAVEINGEFLHWVDKNRDRPFFVFLNYMDVHDPYIYRDQFAGRISFTVPGNLPDPPATSELVARLNPSRLDYESSLAYLDDR